MTRKWLSCCGWSKNTANRYTQVTVSKTKATKLNEAKIIIMKKRRIEWKLGKQWPKKKLIKSVKCCCSSRFIYVLICDYPVCGSVLVWCGVVFRSIGCQDVGRIICIVCIVLYVEKTHLFVSHAHVFDVYGTWKVQKRKEKSSNEWNTIGLTEHWRGEKNTAQLSMRH